jgi:MFS family permease
MCFWIIIPYLPAYLNKGLGVNVEISGYILGVSMLVGPIFSIYGGFLADRFNKYLMYIYLLLLLTCLFFIFPLASNLIIILALLTVINVTSSSMSVICNAWFSELLPQEERSKAFTLRYTLENIGAATGPFLGTLLITQSIGAPFLIAGIFGILTMLMLLFFRNKFINNSEHGAIAIKKENSEILTFSQMLNILRQDKKLILFIIGGLLSMAIYAPLTTYLSQYLVTIKSYEEAYRTVAYVSAVNATIVIAFQYIIGINIKKEKAILWLRISMMSFIIGLFILSNTVIMGWWIVAIIIFTLGEIIIVPLEYIFIDSIAPANLKGSYFGAQNLIYIGVMVGPVMCGFLLNRVSSQMMFYALILIVVLALLFYQWGYNKKLDQIEEVETL